MSGVFNKAMVYLGLVEEPEDVPDRLPVNDYDEAHAPRRRATRTATLDPEEEWDSTTTDAEVRVISLRDRERPAAAPAEAHVRLAQGGVRAAVARVAAFEDVETVAQRLRTGQPVLLDLTEVDTTTARRVLDFVSGANFALGGRMQPFGGKAFLALPDGGTVPAEELERLAALGYHQVGS